MRDLADWFAKHEYELRGNSVGIEVAGVLIEFKKPKGKSCPTKEPLRIYSGRAYTEDDFSDRSEIEDAATTGAVGHYAEWVPKTLS